MVRKHIRGAAYIQDRGTRKYSQWNCLPPSLLMGTIFYVFYVCSWSMLNVLSSCLHCVGCIDLLHLPTYLQAKECYHNANIIEIQKYNLKLCRFKLCSTYFKYIFQKFDKISTLHFKIIQTHQVFFVKVKLEDITQTSIKTDWTPSSEAFLTVFKVTIITMLFIIIKCHSC